MGSSKVSWVLTMFALYCARQKQCKITKATYPRGRSAGLVLWLVWLLLDGVGATRGHPPMPPSCDCGLQCGDGSWWVLIQGLLLDGQQLESRWGPDLQPKNTMVKMWACT